MSAVKIKSGPRPPAKTSPSHLATVLKEERKRAGFTQAQLAFATGLGLKTIRKIEQDDPSVLFSNVNRLLHFFGLQLIPGELVSAPPAKRVPIKPVTRQDVMQTLRGLKQIFATKYGVTELGLFGSYARDEQSEGSDIDILFAGKTSISDEGKMALVLENLLGGRKIDLTNKARLDERLADSILREVIYA